MLRQVLGVMEQQKANLIIAGDVFDSANPSLEAQELFLKMMVTVKRLCKENDKRCWIIVGNHDSNRRLLLWRDFLLPEIDIVDDTRWVEWEGTKLFLMSFIKPVFAQMHFNRFFDSYKEAFKAYNRRDVETELSIQERLAKFPVPENVWEEYAHDQEINDRGVALDMALVRNAIKADARSRTKLTRLMKELTDLDNPNSLQQMKQWLADNGMETDSLGKKVVTELLKDAPEPLGKVLSLRQQLAKSSIKKYQTMENAVCADGRARGMFQFYGANRTGRWAGRLIQMQNLPQNHLIDLEEAR